MGAVAGGGLGVGQPPLEVTAAVTWKLQVTSRDPMSLACSLAVAREDTE